MEGQVFLMLEQYFNIDEEAGSLYSVEDLLNVKLISDDLSTFIHNWDSAIAGLNHQPEETTLRNILLRERRGSSKLKFELKVHDRAKEGDEKHTGDYLVKCVNELLTRERTRRNRTAIAKVNLMALPEVVNRRNLLCIPMWQMSQGQQMPFEQVKADQSRGRTPPKWSKGGRGGSGGSGKGGGRQRLRINPRSHASSTPRAPVRTERTAVSFTRMPAP